MSPKQHELAMGKKNKGLVKSSINKRELTQQVINFFENHQRRAFSLKSIFSEMGLTKRPLRMHCVDILND